MIFFKIMDRITMSVKIPDFMIALTSRVILTKLEVTVEVMEVQWGI